MEFGVYVVRDKVAEQCGPIFQAVNEAVARRNFIHMLEKVPSYDRDAYELLKIGFFHAGTGELESCQPLVIDVDIPKFSEVDQRKFDFVGENDG